MSNFLTCDLHPHCLEVQIITWRYEDDLRNIRSSIVLIWTLLQFLWIEFRKPLYPGWTHYRAIKSTCICIAFSVLLNQLSFDSSIAMTSLLHRLIRFWNEDNVQYFYFTSSLFRFLGCRFKWERETNFSVQLSTPITQHFDTGLSSVKNFVLSYARISFLSWMFQIYQTVEKRTVSHFPDDGGNKE